MCSTMLSDLYSGQDLSKAYATLGSAAGAGAIIGSFVAGRIMAFGFQAKHCFALGSLMSLSQLLINMLAIPETLKPENQRPFDMKFPYMSNPLAFTKLFTKSHALRMLVLVAGLQCVPEGKNISDLQQVPASAAHSLLAKQPQQY
jgi:DHA1 family tetracycline resistance protein-like MFS transporter